MILYFTGTCNSLFVARSLGKALGLRVFPAIHINTVTEPLPEQIGIVFPIYSWGVPPLIMNILSDLRRLGVKRIWSVCTCGDEVALAPEMLRHGAERVGISLLGIWSVIMPNNYVLLPGFDADREEVAEKKLNDSQARISYISSKISANDWELDVVRGSMPWLKTKAVYPLFKRWGTDFGKWIADKSICIGCGKCAQTCPADNIHMKDGRPEWSDRCLSCVACFHVCPVRAIDYSGFTKGKHQYSKLFWLLSPKCREDR